MTNKQLSVTRRQNRLVRQQLQSHCAALKNWLASAVEQGDIVKAKDLVEELREYEAMYHIFVPDELWEKVTN